MPQEAAKSIVSAQVSDAEEPALLVQPFQAIPFADISEGLKANPAQPPRKGTSPRVLRLILLSLPRKWPKQN